MGKMKKVLCNGYQVQFCLPHGRNWKANLWLDGAIVDVVPVTWVGEHSRKLLPDGNLLQTVYFTDPIEADVVVREDKPFLVAIATAMNDEDFAVRPMKFNTSRAFSDVCLVVPTSREVAISPHGHGSIKTRVIGTTSMWFRGGVRTQETKEINKD